MKKKLYTSLKWGVDDVYTTATIPSILCRYKGETQLVDDFEYSFTLQIGMKTVRPCACLTHQAPKLDHHWYMQLLKQEDTFQHFHHIPASTINMKIDYTVCSIAIVHTYFGTDEPQFPYAWAPPLYIRMGKKCVMCTCNGNISKFQFTQLCVKNILLHGHWSCM